MKNHILYIRGRFEFCIDLQQWIIGWNYYKDVGLNVFIGPVRFGWMIHLFEPAY